MIPNYRDSTMGSIFRRTDQPLTRSALLTAIWRGCEGGVLAAAPPDHHAGAEPAYRGPRPHGRRHATDTSARRRSAPAPRRDASDCSAVDGTGVAVARSFSSTAAFDQVFDKSILRSPGPTGARPSFTAFRAWSRRHSDAAKSCRKCPLPRPQRVPSATRGPPPRSASVAEHPPGTARPWGRLDRKQPIGGAF